MKKIKTIEAYLAQPNTCSIQDICNKLSEKSDLLKKNIFSMQEKIKKLIETENISNNPLEYIQFLKKYITDTEQLYMILTIASKQFASGPIGIYNMDDAITYASVCIHKHISKTETISSDTYKKKRLAWLESKDQGVVWKTLDEIQTYSDFLYWINIPENQEKMKFGLEVWTRARIIRESNKVWIKAYEPIFNMPDSCISHILERITTEQEEKKK